MIYRNDVARKCSSTLPSVGVAADVRLFIRLPVRADRCRGDRFFGIARPADEQHRRARDGIVKVLVFDLLADDANPDVARQALKRLIYDNLLQLRGHYASFLNSNPGVTLTGIGILAKIIAPQRRYSPIVRELPEASRTFDTFMVRSQSPCRPYIFFVGRLPPGSRHWHAALRRAPLRCSSAKITGHRICLPMT
jgi:hypothetical protein